MRKRKKNKRRKKIPTNSVPKRTWRKIKTEAWEEKGDSLRGSVSHPFLVTFFPPVTLILLYHESKSFFSLKLRHNSWQKITIYRNITDMQYFKIVELRFLHWWRVTEFHFYVVFPNERQKWWKLKREKSKRKRSKGTNSILLTCQLERFWFPYKFFASLASIFWQFFEVFWRLCHLTPGGKDISRTY